MNASPEGEPRKIPRRQALQELGAFLLAPPFIKAAAPEFSTFYTSLLERRETRPNTPIEGDVVIVNRRPYLIRLNRRFPIRELGQYMYFSEMKERGNRMVFENPGTQIERIPEGVVRGDGYEPDPFTGRIHRPLPDGGRSISYFSGILTDNDSLYTTIFPERNTFADFRREMEKNDFTDMDSYDHTYGARYLGGPRAVEFKASDTLRNPNVNKQNVREFMETRILMNPLAQHVLVGHSQGAYNALQAAMMFPDAVDVLILFSGPLRGIEGSLENRIRALTFKVAVKLATGLNEDVSEHYFSQWSDKKYQKELDDFSAEFVASRKTLICAASSDDPIIAPSSATLKGAENIILPFGGVNPQTRHGASRRDAKTLERGRSAVGFNRVAA